MKIGIVTTWFERGAAYVSKQYKDSFISQGHEVLIYARGGEKYAKGDPNWDSDSVYWQKAKSFPIFNYVELEEFDKWLELNNFDFVIFNEQIWFEPVIHCKRRGVKVGAYIDYYTEPMIKCFDIYDFLLCNTKKHLQAFKNHINAIYVPWGTDISLFDCRSSRTNSHNVRFFHSCGMNPHRKGTDLLLKAYLSFDGDELDSTELIVHTQLSKDLLLANLSSQEKAKFNSILGDRITIIDKTVTAPGLYHLGDVYVYPSRLDGLGLTVCEAISCGMPIIVPSDGPMNEFTHSEFDSLVEIDKLYARYDGYYWPQNECNILDLKFKMLESKDKFLSTKNVSGKIRSIAEEHFDWLKNTSDLVEKIESVTVVKVDDITIEYCQKFNEKKFPMIYKFKKFYKFAFVLYKKISR